MSEKVKRTSISLEKKYRIIKMIDNKTSYEDIVKAIGNDLKKEYHFKDKNSKRENNK